MITNERQYRITKAEAERFRVSLRRFDEIELAKQGIDPVIITAQRDAMEQQLADLETQLAAYDALRSGVIKRYAASSVEAIGEKLIEARIAQGLSQKALADRLGMKEQQIQRYEQERYLTASLSRIASISEALSLDLVGFFEPRQELKSTAEPVILQEGEVKQLPIKEMANRGWLEEFRREVGLSSASNLDLAAAFIANVFRENAAPSLHKQHVRSGSKQNPYALLAWKARVLFKARRASLDVVRRAGRIDVEGIRQLVALSEVGDGPIKAVELLRTYGILVVFERHLPSTHLDGAAMLLHGEVPVIGMTLRLDRLDNFWFVLLHEVAHTVLHRTRGLRDGFFDDEETPAIDAVEAEADEYARNAFIPREVWERAFIRYTASAEQVIQFARQQSVSAAIVAGRIRRERQDWRLFSELVGSGAVQKMFEQAGYLERSGYLER